MIDENVDDLVEVLEILNIDLGKPPLSKIMKADLEALVDIPAEWSAGVHVRLHTHQEHGVEAFGLAICAYVSTSETVARKGIAQAVSMTKNAGEPLACQKLRPEGCASQIRASSPCAADLDERAGE